jgi:hypothetical protein
MSFYKMLKRGPSSSWCDKGLPTSKVDDDLALQCLVTALMNQGDLEGASENHGVLVLAVFLNERICISLDIPIWVP